MNTALGATSTHRRRPRWVRLRVLLALGLVCGAGVTPSLASWTGREHAGATLTAGTVPSATVDECSIRSTLLGVNTAIRIFWTAPPGYGSGDAVLEFSVDGAESGFGRIPNYDVVANTVDLGSGRFRTEVSLGLLGGLLGFNRDVWLGLSVSEAPDDPEAWTSERSVVKSNLGLAAGIGASCVVVP